ncbi:MAG TPA: class I SAM-dependent methyltransferase [Candidatus Acidoferrum sp.]|nr:class I SAM-dependent methyltransferase [Candidatus Acidoferrum sp.]
MIPYSYLHETERKEWQNPEAILVSVGLQPGFTFMDVGCGDGFFTLPAARIVGNKGRVYALDVDEDAIGRLRERASQEDLVNLTLEVGEAEKLILCEGCADIVFFGIVLHDFKSAAKVLSNARKMLKRDGKLVDLDWKKKPMEFGPPLRIRFSEEEATSLIETAGFKIEELWTNEPFHYVIIAKPCP